MTLIHGKSAKEDPTPTFFTYWEWKSRGKGELPCVVGHHPLFEGGIEFEVDELFVINSDGTLRKSKTSTNGPHVREVLINRSIKESSLSREGFNDSKNKDYQKRCSEEGSNIFVFSDFGKKYPPEWFEEYEEYIGEAIENDSNDITEELPKKEAPKETSLVEFLVLLILTLVVVYGLWTNSEKLLFILH